MKPTVAAGQIGSKMDYLKANNEARAGAENWEEIKSSVRQSVSSGLAFSSRDSWATSSSLLRLPSNWDYDITFLQE